jgi:epoxyqueuosine reductase QueG
MENLQDTLIDFAKDRGIDLFGVADLTFAREFIQNQGGEYLSQFPRGISIGMRLLDAVIDELFQHEDPSIVYTYRGLYNSVNANLDRVALLIAEQIQNSGFSAYPIPASQMIDPLKLQGVISHKLVAHLAGHGWIGKSCLLITPEYGPRVRWATVLTNAPFISGSSIPNNCGDCKKCVDICPPKAFTGIPFNPLDSRDLRFKAYLCDEYTEKRKERLGEGICGLCVHICPHGSSNP